MKVIAGGTSIDPGLRDPGLGSGCPVDRVGGSVLARAQRPDRPADMLSVAGE